MIENSWFYYFSSLAQTIAASSALLVALAIIRLQNIDNSLNTIERSIAESFFNIAELDNYRKEVSIHVLNEEWLIYFNNVKKLAKRNKKKFSTTGDYSQSKEFLYSLINQGYKLEVRNRQLNRTLVYVFAGTVIFAGTAILVIPMAQWITPWTLWILWGLSGIFLIIIFVNYYLLVLNVLKPKKVEKVK